MCNLRGGYAVRYRYGYTLAWWEIQEKTTFHMVQRLRGGGSFINVELLTGKIIRLVVHNFNTTSISHIKTQISNKVSMSIDEMILTFEGRELEDGCTLADYKITDWSTLRVREATPADDFVAGGTTLQGNSSQQFQTAIRRLKLDESKAVRVIVRLVGRGSDRSHRRSEPTVALSSLRPRRFGK